MFKDFLKTYIKELVDLAPDDYDLGDAELEEVADTISDDDLLWQYIDSFILDEIYKYKKKEDLPF